MLAMLFCLLSQGIISAAARSPAPFMNKTTSESLMPFRRTPQDRIPKILHQIHLAGKEELQAMIEDPESRIRVEWHRNCVHHHEGWKFMFWDMPAALELLKREYPWFLDTFQSYKHLMQQGDALRYFILHSYGGLYLDNDVECFRATDSFLHGYDLVMNREYKGQAFVATAVMASSPKLQFWREVFAAMQVRSSESETNYEQAIVSTTGPFMLTDTLNAYPCEDTNLPDEFVHITKRFAWRNKEVIKLYESGSWFTPCAFNDEDCHAHVLQAKQDGTLDLDLLAGYHHYKGTWKP